ncbi:MAG TPA: hypothetical protein VFE47_29975 [Tepidisphaeraceae bacterium]|jgi:Fe-S-cluster containining protein|nr:hypothetical protein [Tepidisphaeraceae bacterium]
MSQFEEELRQAVLAAAGRVDVGEAVAAVYSALADEIDLRRPICKTSGRCCRFEEFGHRLYVTTLELAKFVGDRSASQAAFNAQNAAGAARETGDCAQGPGRRGLPIFPNPKSEISNPAPTAGETGCRFQISGLCGVHAIRPFGCRIFFCDETSTQWQHALYERLHGKLRSLHDELRVPYHYVEWRFALKVCL